MRYRLLAHVALTTLVCTWGLAAEKSEGKKKVFQEGIACWYGKDFHGKKTANGELFDMYKLTAAHLTLPFGTFVEVTNLSNGKKVIVRINDRGPYTKGRIIDLSYAAAKEIGIVEKGITRVQLRIVKGRKNNNSEGEEVDNEQ